MPIAILHSTGAQVIISNTACCMLCAVLQMEREVSYNHYLSSLQFHNLSKLDDLFRQRVLYMTGVHLVDLQPHVAAGERCSCGGMQDT